MEVVAAFGGKAAMEAHLYLKSGASKAPSRANLVHSTCVEVASRGFSHPFGLGQRLRLERNLLEPSTELCAILRSRARGTRRRSAAVPGQP